MIEKPPPHTVYDLATLITWGWMIGISLLGGLASFVNKVRTGKVRPWNFTEFVGEIVIAALVGVITANLCKWLGYPEPLTYALVGISSHMGSRALFKLEALFESKFPVTPPKDPDHEA